MKSDLWHVMFIGGPKDGETYLMKFEGSSYHVYAMKKRKMVEHVYIYEGFNDDLRVVVAVYKGVAK